MAERQGECTSTTGKATTTQYHVTDASGFAVPRKPPTLKRIVPDKGIGKKVETCVSQSSPKSSETTTAAPIQGGSKSKEP